MFSLKEKYTLDKPNNEIDFINYSLISLATINYNTSNISISFPREDSYFRSQNPYLSNKSEVLKYDDTRYADGDEIALVNFGPVAVSVRLR